MAERVRLEIEYGSDAITGSNPVVSACTTFISYDYLMAIFTPDPPKTSKEELLNTSLEK